MPGTPYVALETTLLLHGVPRTEAKPLANRLAATVREHGAIPRLAGVVRGKAVVGMTDAQLDEMLAAGAVRKVNTANLGAAMFRGEYAATTVSTTMELAAGMGGAGVSVFATGGIGGVHKRQWELGSGQWGREWGVDVSADLAAFTRFPVAVVCSGVKSILDVRATREMLETLGVPVIGYRTDVFPAFYLREPDEEGVGGVDARFEDAEELARFVRFELARTGRGIVVCNPIAPEHEIGREDWRRWLGEAEERVSGGGVVRLSEPDGGSEHPARRAGPPGAGSHGRDATPALLGALHEISGGATLRANVELVVANAELAAKIAVGMCIDGPSLRRP